MVQTASAPPISALIVSLVAFSFVDKKILSFALNLRVAIVQRKTNSMHNLFLVYFVNLYMFRAYLGPSSGGTTVCIQPLVLDILFRCLSVVLVGLDRTKDSHLIIIIIIIIIII